MVYPDINEVRAFLDEAKPNLPSIDRPVDIWTPDAGFCAPPIGQNPVLRALADWVGEGAHNQIDTNLYRLSRILACIGTTTSSQLVAFPHRDPNTRFSSNIAETAATTNPSTMLFYELEDDLDFYTLIPKEVPVVELPEYMQEQIHQDPEGSLVRFSSGEIHSEAPLPVNTAKAFYVAIAEKHY